jgi:translation initiation factor IF-1
MKHNHHPLTGVVQNVFAHRFTLQTDDGVILADLTPHGAEKIKLSPGDQVTIEGEQKPSEIKVGRIKRGDLTVTIDHPKKHDHDHEGDPKAAVASARAAGFEVFGEPRRKPKHFEILGRQDGRLSELHVTLDGDIRHAKPVHADEPKWQAEIARTHR